MDVGLIDVDALSRGRVTFPNLALMKLSAWHKAQGDSVEWHEVLGTKWFDRVYLARVFGDGYTRDYSGIVRGDVVIRGGSGYAISIKDGLESYDKTLDPSLPDEIEHIMPDYGLYGITDTAYGFLTRGCPRGCDFCHVKDMQGRAVRTVARLPEFWAGQKNIVLLDPNISASRDYFLHMDDLARSGARVDFSQGLDIRLMTREKVEALKEIRTKTIHFAWDNPEDDLEGRLHEVSELLIGTRKSLKQKITVYVLINFGSSMEHDLRRIYAIRDAKMQPFVMCYRKETATPEQLRLMRWVNNPFIFWKVDRFEDYDGRR